MVVAKKSSAQMVHLNFPTAGSPIALLIMEAIII
jgi:hypothetical protein